jgi:acetyl esterase/lipase
MADPQAVYVGERREAMRAWMAAVRCPVLVLQGRAEGLHKINTELLVPELRSLGKEVAVANYPDVKHGFYFGSAASGATPELVDRVVKESIDFISGLPAAADGKAR